MHGPVESSVPCNELVIPGGRGSSALPVGVSIEAFLSEVALAEGCSDRPRKLFDRGFLTTLAGSYLGTVQNWRFYDMLFAALIASSVEAEEEAPKR